MTGAGGRWLQRLGVGFADVAAAAAAVGRYKSGAIVVCRSCLFLTIFWTDGQKTNSWLHNFDFSPLETGNSPIGTRLQPLQPLPLPLPRLLSGLIDSEASFSLSLSLPPPPPTPISRFASWSARLKSQSPRVAHTHQRWGYVISRLFIEATPLVTLGHLHQSRHVIAVFASGCSSCMSWAGRKRCRGAK